MNIRRIYTGHGDTTIEKTSYGLQFESILKDLGKDIFKIAKKEKIEDGCLLTSIDGHEWEFYGGDRWAKEYDDDDLARLKKGSVAGQWVSQGALKLCVGFSPDYIEKTLKKYFVEA